MGADIGFYIQKKDDDKWENVFLFKADNEVAAIWRRGWDVYQEIKDNWMRCYDNIDELTKRAGWIIDENDDDIVYWASLAKIKYFTEKYDPYYPYDTEEEVFDANKFYKGLVKEIDTYLDLTDNWFVDMDRIRIIALVSY